MTSYSVSGIVVMVSSSSMTVFILALANDVWVKRNFKYDAKFDMVWYYITTLIWLLLSTWSGLCTIQELDPFINVKWNWIVDTRFGI